MKGIALFVSVGFLGIVFLTDLNAHEGKKQQGHKRRRLYRLPDLDKPLQHIQKAGKQAWWRLRQATSPSPNFLLPQSQWQNLQNAVGLSPRTKNTIADSMISVVVEKVFELLLKGVIP